MQYWGRFSNSYCGPGRPTGGSLRLISGLFTVSALAGIAVAFLSVSIPGTSELAEITSVETRAARLRAVEGYGKLPLYFIENQGQLDARVAYYIQGRDKSIYFVSGEKPSSRVGRAFAAVSPYGRFVSPRSSSSSLEALPFQAKVENRLGEIGNHATPSPI